MLKRLQLKLDLKIDKIKGFALILIISLFLTALLFLCGAFNFFDQFIYDRLINYRVLHDPQRNDPRIATIDINDESIELLEEQMDSRKAITDAFEVLALSNASMAIDFLLRYEKQNDDDLINAVKNINDAVIAAVAVTEEHMENKSVYKELTDTEKKSLSHHVWRIKVLDRGLIPKAGTFILPFKALTDSAAQVALINVDPDSDGLYRRVSLLYEWDGGFVPSLPLAAAVLHYQIPVEKIELKAGSHLALPLSDEEIIKIPIDERGRMMIPYFQNWKDDTRRIPFYKIALAKDDPSFEYSSLNNRIALIAEINTTQKDFGPVSFEGLYPLSGIHTTVLSGILNGLNERTFIQVSSLTYKVLILFIIIILTFFIIYIKRDLLFSLIYFCAFLILSALTFFRWQSAAISPWFSLPASLLLFLWAGIFLSRLISRYKEQLLLHTALSRYFPRALSQRIMREGKTDLKPAYKEVTILFSDISGFTKWSSDKNPEDVHSFLNDYLESMAEIIFAHGGTVDKFMGDGILAFFGDPLEMPDHCVRCLNGAVAMQKKIAVLAEKWKPVVDIDLKVRIGVNTGKVIVGNLGSKTRIEYTVIGADVNVAQRMESNAPIGGILVTEAVREKVKDKFEFSEKKEITVKGYTDSIIAYVLKQG